MSYSRRQLYALGEPLGESVTRLKPGGRVYGGGGSGGGGDTSTQTQTQDLPDWAKPYAKDILSQDDSISIANSKFTDANLRSTLTKGQREMSIFSTIGNLNNEAFENIVKEFLNINNFPTDPKDKVSILRRFIPLYKKIKSDKNKMSNFIKRLSEKLSEPETEIRVK